MTSVFDGYLVDPKVSLLDKTRMQAQVLVPVLRALRTELGKEKADAIVKQALRDWSKELFAAIGDSVEGSPRRKWATMQSANTLPLRRILPRTGRARTRGAADMRDRFRHRLGERRRSESRPRPDHYAGRAELHIPLQVRAAVVVRKIAAAGVRRRQPTDMTSAATQH